MLFDKTEVWGLEHALRGMRNPMNSWEKSDSGWCIENKFDFDCYDCPVKNTCGQYVTATGVGYVVGENDMKLAQRLISGGTEHRKFLRQIMVVVDITAPLYWWKEFDTYKVGTVSNSTSTMHKLATTPITIDCFETDDYNADLSIIEFDDESYTISEHIEEIIDMLEQLRVKYLETNDKRYWKELIRWLPESWLQTRTVTMNYENLRTMYHQRKNHKLNEWSGKDNPELENFASWIKRLPYAEEFIMS